MSNKFANYAFTGGAVLTLVGATALTILGAVMAMEEVTPRGLVVLAAAAGCWACAGTILRSIKELTERGWALMLNFATSFYSAIGTGLLFWALLLPNW